MRHVRWVGCAAFALATLACDKPQQQGLTTEQSVAIADTSKSVMADVAAMTNALDVNRISQLFSNDPDLAVAVDGQLMLVSHDSLVAFYRAAYKNFRTMAFAWDTTRISVLAPDAAVVSAAGHYTFTDTTGRSASPSIAALFVFVRRNGKWQLFHFQEAHRAPPK
jgi:uncharacterized protein (TIGR02246 family)